MKTCDLFARAVDMIAGKTAMAGADVERMLRDCEARAATAARDHQAQIARRHDLLIGGSDAELADNEAKIAKIKLEQERSEAIAAELRVKLAGIVATEASAEMTRRRGEVDSECDAATRALRTRYPKLIEEARALLRTIATAQKSVAAFRRDFPKEPGFADPENAARQGPMVEDSIVSEREVWRWEYLNGVPLDEAYYPGVYPATQRGVVFEQPLLDLIEAGRFSGNLNGPFESRGVAVRLVRRKRREVLRHERPLPTLPLAETLALPGLHAGELGWVPVPGGAGHEVVLAELGKMVGPSERKKTVVEYLPA